MSHWWVVSSRRTEMGLRILFLEYLSEYQTRYRGEDAYPWGLETGKSGEDVTAYLTRGVEPPRGHMVPHFDRFSSQWVLCSLSTENDQEG